MVPFYGLGSTASRLEPLRGGSLLLPLSSQKFLVLCAIGHCMCSKNYFKSKAKEVFIFQLHVYLFILKTCVAQISDKFLKTQRVHWYWISFSLLYQRFYSFKWLDTQGIIQADFDIGIPILHLFLKVLKLRYT